MQDHHQRSNDDIEMEFEEQEVKKPVKEGKLNEDNLSKLGNVKKASGETKSKKSKKSQKPAWAVSQKE
jgi:hypothetical protein